MSASFWSTFWENYCDITHFHGFREMYEFESRWSRAYWLVGIIGGFFLAFTLMGYGIKNNIEDPVNTVVSVNRDGEVDTHVLHCPAMWIDPEKVKNLQGNPVYVDYALTHLQKYALRLSRPKSYKALVENYQDIMNYLNNHARLQHFDHTIELFFVLAAIKGLLEGSPIPRSYSPFTRESLETIRAKGLFPSYLNNLQPFDLSSMVDKSKLTNFYLALLQRYMNNDTEEIFDLVYKHLPVGYMIKFNETQEEGLYLHRPFDFPAKYLNYNLTDMFPATVKITETLSQTGERRIMIQFMQRNGLSVGGWRQVYEKLFNNPGSENHVFFHNGLWSCFTIETLDRLNKMENGTNKTFIAKTLSESRCWDAMNVSRISPLSLEPRLWIENLLTNLFDTDYTRMDMHRTKVVVNAIQNDSQFQMFAANPSYGDHFRRALGDYLMSNDSDMLRLAADAEDILYRTEKQEFKNFLQINGFTNNPYGLLESISVDINKFAAWISYSPNGIDWPPNATISGSKTLKDSGICISFHVYVPPRLVSHQVLNAVIRKPKYREYTQKFTKADSNEDTRSSVTYHVSIWPLYASKVLDDDASIIAFGDAAFDKYPAQTLEYSYETPSLRNTFQIENMYFAEIPDWDVQHLHFEVGPTETYERINRQGSQCQALKDNKWNTFNNCIYACNNEHQQPKEFKGRFPFSIYAVGDEMYCLYAIECYFGLASQAKTDTTSNMTECSYFSINQWRMSANKTCSQPRDRGEQCQPYESCSDWGKCLKSCNPCITKTMAIKKSLGQDNLDLYYSEVRTNPDNYIRHARDWLHFDLADSTMLGPLSQIIDPNNETQQSKWSYQSKIATESNGQYASEALATNVTLVFPKPENLTLSENQAGLHINFFNIINYLSLLNITNAGQRIQIEINSDNIGYREKEAFTWDAMFGVVGGQIGLVTGASCLTFVQIVWVVLRTLYQLFTKKRMRSYALVRN